MNFLSSFEKVAAVNIFKGRIRAGISPSALKAASLPAKPINPMVGAQEAAKATQRTQQATSAVTPPSLWRRALREGK